MAPERPWVKFSATFLGNASPMRGHRRKRLPLSRTDILIGESQARVNLVETISAAPSVEL